MGEETDCRATVARVSNFQEHLRGAAREVFGSRVLGGYEVTGLLGTGGMGSVYLAEHPQLARKLAIKILHPHLTGDSDMVSRFLAEARAASTLEHPNIIEVIDAAALGEGLHYIALEYLDGQSLADFLDSNGPLEPEIALRILAQAGCALEAAHQRGIIHRDLKPANLFIAPTELEPLRVKLLDFGIAKLGDAFGAGVETRTGAVAGTPGYMSPEQARGMRDVDHRADIYALGVIAYRMLSGRKPYDGDSLGEVIYQQLTSPPANLREHRPNLPDGWIAAVMSALGAEPSMRPPSARDFVNQLTAATPDGEAITREAAPLLFSPSRIAANRALVAQLERTPTRPRLAPGGTATLRERPACRARKNLTRFTGVSRLIGHGTHAHHQQHYHHHRRARTAHPRLRARR